MKDLKPLKPNLEKEIDKIRKKKHTSINWYDLESEIDRIKGFDTFEEKEVLLYEFQKLFSNQNKSIINAYDKDLVIYKILETIILNNPIQVSATELKEKEYFIDSGIKNAVDKSLKVLNLYEIIDKNKITLQQNRKEYTLNLNKWYKKSKYRINDNEVLAILAPLITSYINIGFINEFNIEIFFEKISNIIEYTIQPSAEHNKYFELEYEITFAIEMKDKLYLLIKNRNTYEEIEIAPISIIFNNGKKYLRYKNNETNKYETKELNDLKLKLEEDIEDTNIFNANISMLKTEDIKIKQPPKKVELKQIKLLLECDSVIYEYFNMLPLSNMIIYDEEKKLKEFSKKYNYDCMPNKFYIEATDYKEKCISVIFHCLENVKIIEPTELKNDIIERVKIFTKKNNIDICKEDNTPPTPPIKPDNKQTLKEETPIENNENIEIDKNGLVEKIKNSKGGNLNL